MSASLLRSSTADFHEAVFDESTAIVDDVAAELRTEYPGLPSKRSPAVTARMVVEGAVRLHGCLVQTLGARAASFKQVADPDQIFPFVKRMLVKQSEFGALGKQCEVHIALHYTRAETWNLSEVSD